MDWDSFKAIFQMLLVPTLGLFGYHYKRHLEKMDELNTEVSSMKVKNAMIKTQLMSINSQLKEMKTLMNILISKLDK